MRVTAEIPGSVHVRVRWRDLWRLIMDGWVSGDGVTLWLGDK